MDPKDAVALLAQAALFLVVFSFGLQSNARDVFDAFADKKTIMKAILAVNFVVPAAALVVCSVIKLDPAVRIGIVLMALSPLAPLAPGKMAKGDLPTSKAVGLYIVLILSAVVLVPLTVWLLSALLPANASVSLASIWALVAETILLPILLGTVVGTIMPRVAHLAARVTSAVGMIGVAMLVALIIYAQRGAAAALLGDGTGFAILLIVGAGIGAGHLLGRRTVGYSNAFAMAAAIRHPGIAAMIAQRNFDDPRVVLAIVLFLVVSIIATAAYQRWTLQPGAKTTKAAAA
jgi:bile acid:Na+ symporter, BASS family